jgi:hypothetical protein
MSGAWEVEIPMLTDLSSYVGDMGNYTQSKITKYGVSHPERRELIIIRMVDDIVYFKPQARDLIKEGFNGYGELVDGYASDVVGEYYGSIGGRWRF